MWLALQYIKFTCMRSFNASSICEEIKAAVHLIRSKIRPGPKVHAAIVWRELMKSFISPRVPKSWVRPRFFDEMAPCSCCVGGFVRPRPVINLLEGSCNAGLVLLIRASLAIVGFRLDRRSVLICLFRFADRKVFVELHRRSLEDVRYSSFKRCFS